MIVNFYAYFTPPTQTRQDTTVLSCLSAIQFTPPTVLSCPCRRCEIGISFDFVALCAGLAESSSEVKLAQLCQSAPTRLVTKTTEGCSTRDAGQQTSETQLMRRATVTETVWSVCEKDALTALTTAADANCPSYPHLTLPATAAATEEECQSLEKFSKQVLLSDIVLDSLDNDTDDRHRAVSIAKGQTDCAEMLLAALNTQPMTTVYEDWCMNCDTAKEVGTTLKLYIFGFWH